MRKTTELESVEEKGAICRSAHKRVERWMRLQQFVYGLPDDYSYAIRVRHQKGSWDTRALVQVGWMSWFGEGKAGELQQSLALALVESGEALSANSTRVFFHSFRHWRRRLVNAMGFGKVTPAGSQAQGLETQESEERLMAS